MAHIIEVERHSYPEARSFLDALYYSDSVSAIGFRLCNKTVRVVAVNWDADEESELDERISQLMTDALLAGDDLDAHRRLLPHLSRNHSLPT